MELNIHEFSDINLNMISLIEEEIIHSGWCYIKDITPKQFDFISQNIGHLISKSDIKQKQKSTKFIHSIGKVQYHTDDPQADIIGWHCLSPAMSGGESLFLNINDVFNSLDTWSKTWLSKIVFTIRHPKKGIFSTPFTQKMDDKTVIYYYQPWRIFETLSPEKKEALYYFQSKLKKVIPQKILLKKFDALFLNNRFMLHGRNKFIGDSRHLKRYLWEFNYKTK